jgi:hypothetical protein
VVLSTTTVPAAAVPSFTSVWTACLCECVVISQNLLAGETLHVIDSVSPGFGAVFGGMLIMLLKVTYAAVLV